MPLATRNEIRDRINEERAYFESDSDRAISELADSLTPVYYSEQLAEWAELPTDARDAWQEIGAADNATIFDRMATDLYWYYYNQTAEIYAEESDNWHTCEELQTGVTITQTRIVGNAIAECANCNFKCANWECACELAHDCTETN